MAPFNDPTLDEMISAWTKSIKDHKHLHHNDMDDIIKFLRAWLVCVSEHREKHYTVTAEMQSYQTKMIEVLRSPIIPECLAQKPATRKTLVDIMSAIQVSFVDLNIMSLMTTYEQQLDTERDGDALRAHYLIDSLKNIGVARPEIRHNLPAWALMSRWIRKLRPFMNTRTFIHESTSSFMNTR